MPELTRLDFKRLVRELQGRGATREEAERLAKLAEVVSRTRPSIDLGFADTLERLLLKERASESLAEIIRLGKVLDAGSSDELHEPRLYVLPVTRGTARRRRMMLGAAAAAIVVPLVVFGLALVSDGGTLTRDVWAAEANWRTAPQILNALHAGARQRQDGNPIDRRLANKDDANPSSPTQSPVTGNGCSISGDKSKGAGVVPVPSLNCYSTSEADSPTSPLKGPPAPPTG